MIHTTCAERSAFDWKALGRKDKCRLGFPTIERLKSSLGKDLTRGACDLRPILTTTFPLGQLVATTRALESIPYDEIAAGLRRHALRNWGALCEEDKIANDYAVEHGERILSAYRCSLGFKFWIITEWDRSATTVLLPEEY